MISARREFFMWSYFVTFLTEYSLNTSSHERSPCIRPPKWQRECSRLDLSVLIWYIALDPLDSVDPAVPHPQDVVIHFIRNAFDHSQLDNSRSDCQFPSSWRFLTHSTIRSVGTETESTASVLTLSSTPCLITDPSAGGTLSVLKRYLEKSDGYS